MAKPLEQVEGIFSIALLLGVVVAAVWLFNQFGSDATGAGAIGKAANDYANNFGAWWRSLFDGGKSSDPSEAEKNLDIPAAPFVASDLLPTWVNTSSATIEPDSVDQYSDGYGITGTW